MKTIHIILALLLVAFLSESAFGQPQDVQRRSRGMGPERLEKFKKMRLVEALNLNEDEAVRFTAKYSIHENTKRELMKSRSDLIDRMEEKAREKDSAKELPQLFSQLEENEQKMFNEKKRFRNEIKEMLTPEQAARYFVFDRNFNRELREAMMGMRREKHGQ